MTDGCKGPGASPSERCGRPTVASGLCPSHYQQERRGQTLAPLRKREEVARDRLPGIRVSDETRQALDTEAERRRVPVSTVASDVLESWAKRRRK
jgi:hypothetical protein